MKTKHSLLFRAGAVILLGSWTLQAQDEVKPIVLGGFANSGSFTSGFRFIDVSGYRPKYDELYSLGGGPRLMDFSLFGKAQPGAEHFADSYSFTATGIGGDPYSSAQFTVSKKHLYDLRANFRQTHYYWNRNDAVASDGFTAITSNHDWATVRKLGTVDFTVYASPNLRFSFQYYRNTRDGVQGTTRTLDYFGSSSTWGSFARADPYYLIAPVSESSNRITGGVDYTHRTWNFHYKTGYQQFEDSVDGSNPGPGQRSINTNDPTTAAELLNLASWTDHRKLTTPVSEFSYDGQITSRLSARGGYLFYRYSGPASLDFSANGIARTNSAGTLDAPYAFSASTRAVNSEPNHIVDQGFTYKVNDWWRMTADYRYSRLNVTSTANFTSLNAGVAAAGQSLNLWRIGTSTVDFRMEFTPLPSLLLNAGFRFMKSDVENTLSGITNPEATKRIRSIWPELNAFWQPSKIFSIRGDLDEINNGTSFTRITPHTDVGGRIVARVRPFEKLYLEDTTLIRNRKLLASDFRSTVRSNSGTINWEFDERLSVFAGFSYESFYASDFTTFIRGTAPLTNTITDQTVNRVWQGGIRIAPMKGLGVDITGNYVRSNGLGVIAGEPPLYGPITFPYATGSLHYDVPRLGRVAIELQRTYYIEQIVTANNFSAKLLTIAWTRNF